MGGAQKKSQSDQDELVDLWDTPLEVKSKKFDQYKQGFAKTNHVRVKPLINPKGGISYNPSVKDHKNLLKNVVETEEKQIEKEAKHLKVYQSLHADPDSDQEPVSSESEEDSDVEIP